VVKDDNLLERGVGGEGFRREIRGGNLVGPRKGSTKEGPRMEPFLTMYKICSRRSKRRMKHVRYEVNSMKEKEGKRDEVFLVVGSKSCLSYNYYYWISK